ncbi:hypothetical protein ACLKA7_016500 [Drosophila subpalustris]
MASATVPLLDDDTIPFGEEDEMRDPSIAGQKYTHPYVTFFHLFFRGASIVIYMFCGWFSDSFITSFVFVVLFLSADFWTVKNISGRLLVGLRWWNYVDDDGKSHWVFESKNSRVNKHEQRIFWLGLILCPLFWGLFFLMALFGLKFKWLLLVMIAIALNAANLYGYVKCNYGASKDLNSAATDFVKTQLFKNAVDMMTKPNAAPPTNRIIFNTLNKSNMRGRGGYIPRGGGTMRGGGGYYNNRNSSNYVNTRTQGNYRPNNGRYENNYHHNNRYSGGGGGGGSNNDHYDNRNRDKFNNHHNSSAGGRYDSGSGHKRSYDTSRDRNDERKRPRQDDYRRTSSSNDHNDRPSSSSQNMGSSSSSYHPRSSTGGGGGGGVGSSSSYRPRDDSGSQRHQRDSSMGPPKRPIMRSVAGNNYISRPRGSMSIRGGMMRNNMRGIGGLRIVRPRINESNDLRTMRRQLLFAAQKDRARLAKIQQLKSSLRRQRQGGNSSANSSDDNDDSDNADKDEVTDKKKKKSNDDDGDGNDDDDNANDDEDGADGEEKKSETTKKSPSKKRNSKTANDDTEVKANTDKDEDEEEQQDDDNDSEKKNAENIGSDEENEDDEAKGKTDETADADKPKEKNKSSSTAEKSTGKKKDKDVDDKSKKSSTKKERSSRKDKEDSDEERKERRTTSRHRDEDHSNLRKRTFIKLTCVHCRIKCVTFKEYHYHLNSRTHKNSMRTVALRQRADLQRMRARQRTTQREIEENSKEEYESRYCRLCRLAYRQPKNLHQASEHHKTIKKFLMPYCGSCHLAFKNAMLYENHRCSLEHIRNKARNDESGSEDSVDEREIDLNKFLTVDSVGEIDDDVMDAEVDAMLLEAETAQKSTDEETRKRGLIAPEFIKSVETFFCELCNHYSPKQGDDTLEDYTKKHCLQHSHVKNYLRHKEETEKKTKSEAGDDDDIEGEEEDVAQEPKDNDEAEADEDIEMDGKEDDEDYEGEDPDETHEETLWEDVDKDLGDLLAEVEPLGHEEEDEDESVLNIDIESEKNKANKDEANGNADENVKETKTSPTKSTEKKAATPAKAAAAAEKQETPAAKKATPKAATVTKASRPGPASTKRQVLVNLKRASAATIKAATKPAADSK